MTRQALKKLNNKQLYRLNFYISEMQKFNKAAAKEHRWAEEAERMSKKIRGYVEALRDCEVITETEMRVLYLYFRQIGTKAE